jgi:eukaryotic-like serine/threonine-protein kinase
VSKQWVDAGIAHAERALMRSAGNADALEWRGNLRYLAALTLEPEESKKTRMMADAQADLEAATVANPAQAGAWAMLSHLYYQTGTNVDVNSAAKRALEADAFLENADVVLSRLFLSSYDLGRFRPEAERWCEESQRRFPTSVYAARCQLMLLTTRILEPDVSQAWALADSVVARSPAPQQAIQRLANNLLVAAVLVRAGQVDSARRVVERSRGDEEVDPTRELMLRAAFVQTLLSDTTAAVNSLKIYLAANESRRKAYAEDPGWWFRPIAGSASFRRLVGSSQ